MSTVDDIVEHGGPLIRPLITCWRGLANLWPLPLQIFHKTPVRSSIIHGRYTNIHWGSGRNRGDWRKRKHVTKRRRSGRDARTHSKKTRRHWVDGPPDEFFSMPIAQCKNLTSQSLCIPTMRSSPLTTMQRMGGFIRSYICIYHSPFYTLTFTL